MCSLQYQMPATTCVHRANGALGESTHLLYRQRHKRILGQPCLNCVFKMCLTDPEPGCSTGVLMWVKGGLEPMAVASSVEHLLAGNLTPIAQDLLFTTVLSKPNYFHVLPFHLALSYSCHAAVELNTTAHTHIHMHHSQQCLQPLAGSPHMRSTVRRPHIHL